MFSLIALWDLWNYALKFSLRECPLFRAERGLGENWGEDSKFSLENLGDLEP